MFAGGVEVGGGDGVNSRQADGLGEGGGSRLSRGGGLLGERKRRQNGEENGRQLHGDGVYVQDGWVESFKDA